jgi:iron complex transport system substrate-binding protein
MRRAKYSWLVLGVMLLFGCHVPNSPSPGAVSVGSFPRTIRMADGSEVNIPRKPERIVSLTLSSDEILCGLVDEKRIAGLSKYSGEEATSNVAAIAHRINVFVDRNAEQVVALQPDLLVGARYAKIDLKALLSQTRIPILVTTEFRNFDQIENNIRLIGEAVGEESKATALVSEMKQKIADAQGRLQTNRKGLRVLYLAPGNFTAGSDTSIHELLSAAGFKNAAAESGVKGNVKVASEQIMQINPDIILIATGYERDRGFRQRLESDPQLSALGAIKEQQVVELPARSVLTVSQYTGEAVLALVTAVNQLPMTKGGGE